MEIIITNRSAVAVDGNRIEALGLEVLASLGYRSGELGITFVPVEEVEALNREHLDREGPTDVIAFPLDDEGHAGGPDLPVLLGDVVICPEIARENAAENDTVVDEELCRLVIHGILHIAGFDHERDEGEMLQRQEELAAEMCEQRLTGG